MHVYVIVHVVGCSTGLVKGQGDQYSPIPELCGV